MEKHWASEATKGGTGGNKSDSVSESETTAKKTDMSARQITRCSQPLLGASNCKGWRQRPDRATQGEAGQAMGGGGRDIALDGLIARCPRRSRSRHRGGRPRRCASRASSAESSRYPRRRRSCQGKRRLRHWRSRVIQRPARTTQRRESHAKAGEGCNIDNHSHLQRQARVDRRANRRQARAIEGGADCKTGGKGHVVALHELIQQKSSRHPRRS